MILLSLAFPVAFLSILYFLDRGSQLDSSFLVRDYHYQVGVADHPGLLGNDWRPVSPRDVVPMGDPTSVWYRIPLEGREGLLGVYLPQPFGTVQVFQDDQLVGSSGNLERPLAFYAQPLFFRISHKEDETLYIHLLKERGVFVPPPIYIGDYETFRQVYDADQRIHFWLPVVISVFAYSLTIFVLILACYQRELLYWILAVVQLLWAIRISHSLVVDIPFDHWTWFLIPYLCLWWVPLSIVWINELFALNQSRLTKSVMIVSGIQSVAMIVLLALREFDLLYGFYEFIWVPFTLFCVLVIYVQYVLALVKTRMDFESTGITLIGIFIGIVGFRDYLFDWHDSIPGSTFYLPYAAILPFMFYTFMLARRFARSHQELALLNANLEKTVRQKTREIENSYVAMQELETERALLRERERIMRDMHDGVGGQLIHALALSEEQNNETLREALEQALLDMRLIIDSIDPTESSFIDLLANYRYRLSKVMSKHEIDVHWEIDEDFKGQLRPEISLNLLRIMQEAMTNTIKHSRARNLTIAVRISDAIVVEIADDGIGVGNENELGYGIDNMRKRAAAIGASLTIDSSEKGTAIVIKAPAA